MRNADGSSSVPRVQSAVLTAWDVGNVMPLSLLTRRNLMRIGFSLSHCPAAAVLAPDSTAWSCCTESHVYEHLLQDMLMLPVKRVAEQA